MTDLFEFPLPDIGEGVAEGEIVQWMVKEGDPITEDQEMVEVMTDKATVPITSPIRGTVREILVGAGEVVAVGSVLVKIEPAAGAHVPKVASHGDGHSAPAKKAAPAAKAAPPAKAAPTAKAPPARAATAMPPKSQQAPKSAKAAELPETPQPPAAGEDMETREAPVARGQRPVARSAVAQQAVAPRVEADVPARKTVERPNGQRALATPYTRRLARELTVDIETLEGSGDAGRVTEDDVRAAADAQRAPAPTAKRPAAAPSLSEQVAFGSTAESSGDREERIPIRGLRKRIAERMHQSKTTAAHFTYVDECDVTELVALRGQMKERAAKRGVKLTYLPFITKAIVSAFQEFPTLNGVTDDEAGEFVVKHYFNFGIAVDTDNGLIVPVVKDVDKRSLLDLAQEMDRLATDAREGKSKLEDLKDGTFTITNAGNIGGLFATPIINYPEAAILGVHAIKKRPAVVDGKIEIRDVMYLSISIDHRMNDGAVGARFMNRVIELLQDPAALFLEM